MAFAVSHVGAIALSLVNLVAWGTWPYLRMRCVLQGPSFTILYFSGQFLAALFFSLVLSDSSNDWTTAWGKSPDDSWRVAAIVVGGGCVGNADFLCSLAMSRIDFSIAFPVYAGLALGLGSSLVYFLDRQGDPAKLFGGVAMALLAIFALAAAEAQPHPEPSPQAQAHAAVATQEEEEDGAFSPLHGAEAEKKMGDDAASASSDGNKLSTEESRRWVYLCLFCGLLGSFWSPLSSLGRGDRGVTSPLIALVIFELGQLSSVPLQCCYYSLVLHVMERSPEQRATHRAVQDPMVFLREIKAASLSQKILGLCIGAMVGTGFTLYFLSSASMNATVALAIPSCEPLATIFLGVFVSRTLKNAGLATKILYAASTSFFLAAVILLSLAVVN